MNINAYDEYGIPASTNLGRFQYTGQTWLPELGMYYYKARVYSPTMGRFLQTDPIGYGDGLNWYAYVGNDPVNGVDPTGTDCVTVSSGLGTCEENNATKAEANSPITVTGIKQPPSQVSEVQLRNMLAQGETADASNVIVVTGRKRQKSIWGRVKDAFCALPPLELSGGADAYLGIGASASLGISLDVRTLQVRGSVGGTLGAGFGGGLGVGAGAGATKSGYSQEISGALAAGPGSVTVSQGGLSAGTGPKFGPRLGVWGGVSGKYTTPATPDLTGACNGQ